ncbi:MAG: hypothetical protein DWQ19_11590 [Crenarchaeota archaeon]|nr:MAG: hypothetical protein DWQ19_11590 [Thermoproteota archaeon]
MADKERFSNPVVGDNVTLRLLSYNSNNRASFDSIDKIDIYFLDPDEKTDLNPDGRRLVETIATADITEDEVGAYSTVLTLNSEQYLIGNWVDIWTATVSGDQIEIENNFQIYPNLWFTTPIPIIYDFNFAFRPNRLKKGSKRYLAIEITPNVPNRDQLYSYYENIAITSPVKISIEQECGDCLPAEQDLRLVVEDADVTLREKCMAYYFLDTSDMATGIYNVWFTLELGENVYVSESQQLQIF